MVTNLVLTSLTSTKSNPEPDTLRALVWVITFQCLKFETD